MSPPSASPRWNRSSRTSVLSARKSPANHVAAVAIRKTTPTTGVLRPLTAAASDARIVVAHGQMDEEVLERQMVRFWERDADVLVCTTIIESGLDVPNANTLIVDRADMLGLAQLYQLRGRVGRAAERAFAYFF